MSVTIAHASGVVAPTIQDGYSATIPIRTRAHDILGRTDSEFTFRPAGMRAGRLPLVFESRADAWAAVAILTRGEVFGYEDSDVPEANMSFIVAEGELEPRLDGETRSVWLLDVPFREVLP